MNSWGLHRLTWWTGCWIISGFAYCIQFNKKTITYANPPSHSLDTLHHHHDPDEEEAKPLSSIEQQHLKQQKHLFGTDKKCWCQIHE